MSTGMKMAMRTYTMYLANALLCGLFVLWFEWTWVQTILAAALFVGFCMMCYNEGGWNGERDCTLERTAEKRLQEGKTVDEEMGKRIFDKKNALVCFLVASIPLCCLATANLIASPNYPVLEYVEEAETDASDDPFYYNSDAAEEQAQAQQEAAAEPVGTLYLRVISRVCFVPLLPLYNILANNTTLLYALFIPFSFIMPACTALGYLRGPKIREKKIEEIARGKVRKKRGLLVGEAGVKNQNPHAPKQPRPKV